MDHGLWIAEEHPIGSDIAQRRQLSSETLGILIRGRQGPCVCHHIYRRCAQAAMMNGERMDILSWTDRSTPYEVIMCLENYLSFWPNHTPNWYMKFKSTDVKSVMSSKYACCVPLKPLQSVVNFTEAVNDDVRWALRPLCNVHFYNFSQVFSSGQTSFRSTHPCIYQWWSSPSW